MELRLWILRVGFCADKETPARARSLGRELVSDGKPTDRDWALPLSKHNIRINALAPAVLETNIAPDKALFRSMILTPMSTLCKGVDMLLEEGGLPVSM
jgi:hypothetical protein